MTQATANTAIQRELRIEASPAVVYEFFTDPAKIVHWMGNQATADPRPGGDLLIDYNGFDRMRGRYVELVPNSRVVFTWGWETLGSQTPPGASRVEVDLVPDGAGTILRLVHSGLEGAEVDGHAIGWDLFLPFLADSARTGSRAQPQAAALTPTEAYASRLNAALCELRYLLEGLGQSDWKKVCPGSGWTVGVTANHAVSHLGLTGMASTLAAGERPPQADFTLEALGEFNASNAAANANVVRETVLRALLTDGPKGVETLKALDSAKLTSSQPMAFAGGAQVPVSAIIEGPLLADLAAHIADIRSAR